MTKRRTTKKHSINEGRPKKRSRQQHSSVNNMASNITSQTPTIPGVPMTVVPLLVHAMKATTKYFTCTKSFIRPFSATVPDDATISNRQQQQQQQQQQTDNNTSTTTVVSDLMDRIESSNEDYKIQQKKEREQLNAMEDAVQAWLEAMKRYVRPDYQNNRKHEVSTTTHDSSQDQPSSSSSSSVSLSCFIYIWDIQHEHPRVPVRRAALHFCGLLLERSRDCRCHLLEAQEDNRSNTLLAEWIYTVATASDDISSWKNPEQASRQIPLWQQEAQLLLSHLIEKGYNTLYPRLQVALQRLRQQIPTLVKEDTESSDNTSFVTNSSYNMVDLRRFRDVALHYGNEEILRIEKLVSRSHTCLDVLVPRMGSNTMYTDGKNASENIKQDDTPNGDDDDEDDDDDIDWEDGDADNELGTVEPESHLLAVERTLEAIEASRGLQGGELEIDFAKKIEEMPVHKETQTAVADHAKLVTRFTKCVRLLARRHMPRLSTWIEGLANSDDLVLESSSLILLSSDVAQRRNDLLERLLNLKRVVASVMSSARRLEIIVTPGEDMSGDTCNTSDRQHKRTTIGSNNLEGTRRHLSLAASFQRQRRQTLTSSSSRRGSRSSNRIQIKCRHN